MRKKWANLFVMLPLCLVLLSGCTMPSSTKNLPLSDDQTAKAEINGQPILQEAIQTTNTSPGANQFWYKGYIKNSIEKRTTTSMYDGVVVRPNQAYLVNARMAGKPFQYYRWGDKQFIKSDDVWYKARKEDVLPFDPLHGFSDWLPLFSHAYQLPDDAVLNKPCSVIQVKISGKDWVTKSPSPIFYQLKSQLSSQELNQVLDNTIVKTTFWIGKEDHYIYQYDTWIVMPLPEAGYFDQETFFQFYKFGDVGISKVIQPPEEVQKWVDEFEKQIKSGTLKNQPKEQDQPTE